MPLLDHFHPPLSTLRHWEAFHARWAASIADELNTQLPEGYFAETQVHIGPRIEVDVATFEEPTNVRGGVATLTKISAPDLIVPAVFPDEVTVNIFDTSAGPTLVAAIELVSPANKDRDSHRHAFAIKCASYLGRGVGVMLIDVVTSRQSQPLLDLLELLQPDSPRPTLTPLCAASVRPCRTNETDFLEFRIRPLEVNGVLPMLPLFLDRGQVVQVDLESSYEEARSRSRLG